MKRYIIIFLISGLLWACDDFLTVRPKSEITENELFATPEGVEEGIYGVYSTMAADGLYGKQVSWYIPDILAQYYAVTQSMQGGAWEMANYEYEMDGARGMCDVIWGNMYQAIGYANNVINSLNEKPETSMKLYKLYKGEMLGVRAFMHFDLVRLYAPMVTDRPEERGIPYVRKWESKVTPFSTIGEVYQAVIDELKESACLLEDGEKETAKYAQEERFCQNREIHFNVDAAYAALARVYWMKNDLDSAAVYAEKVIVSRQYSLADVTEVEGVTAGIIAVKEGIWGLYNMEIKENLAKTFYNYSLGLLYPAADYKDWYPGTGMDNDMRLGWFRVKKDEPVSEQSRLYFLKLLDEENFLAPGVALKGKAGINLIRLPEMYLILAEAFLEKDPELATEYFDTFIISRGLVSLHSKGKTVTLEDIMAERKKEFIGEGQEWFAMKRQNRNLKKPSSLEIIPGSPEVYTLKIPLDEFEYRYD